ncbi:hypothetical protein GCM10010483_61460 [Actinokineospora diospyrosa]
MAWRVGVLGLAGCGVDLGGGDLVAGWEVGQLCAGGGAFGFCLGERVDQGCRGESTDPVGEVWGYGAFGEMGLRVGGQIGRAVVGFYSVQLAVSEI